MICIFEVFALNRNEDDFLENLGILNEIRLQNDDMPMMQMKGSSGQLDSSRGAPESPDSPEKTDRDVLDSIRDQMAPAVRDYIEAHMEDKKVKMLFKCY